VSLERSYSSRSVAERAESLRAGRRRRLAGAVVALTAVGGYGLAFVGFARELEGLTSAFTRRPMPPRPASPLVSALGPGGAETALGLGFWLLGGAALALAVALVAGARRRWQAFGAWAGAAGGVWLLKLLLVPDELGALLIGAAAWAAVVGGVGAALRRTEPDPAGAGAVRADGTSRQAAG
jgi:hypothetical protein